MAYGDHDGTPYFGQQVTYVLSLAEYNLYGVQSVYPATITNILTATCVDLQATFTTKEQNPGQSVTLTEKNVTFGNAQGNWYQGNSFTGVLPTGSPW